MTELEVKKLVDVEFERLTNSLTKDLMPPTYKCWIDNLIKMYEKGIKDASRINNTINEEKLDELAYRHAREEEIERMFEFNISDVINAYKAGYKKAKEE